MPGVRGEIPWASRCLLCPEHGASAHHDVRGLADRRHQARGTAFHLAGDAIRPAAGQGGVAGEYGAAGHVAASRLSPSSPPPRVLRNILAGNSAARPTSLADRATADG